MAKKNLLALLAMLQLLLVVGCSPFSTAQERTTITSNQISANYNNLNLVVHVSREGGEPFPGCQPILEEDTYYFNGALECPRKPAEPVTVNIKVLNTDTRANPLNLEVEVNGRTPVDIRGLKTTNAEIQHKKFTLHGEKKDLETNITYNASFRLLLPEGLIMIRAGDYGPNIKLEFKKFGEFKTITTYATATTFSYMPETEKESESSILDRPYLLFSSGILFSLAALYLAYNIVNKRKI
ncbi:hypothetical protein ACFLRC_02515 [Candidatus Altiarchaeota archaeon]